MRMLHKYLNAFKSSGQILEGIKNKMFRQVHIEAEAAYRMSICEACKFLDKVGSECLAPGTQPCCSVCGCSLSLKTRSLSSECPKDKWTAVMNEETEAKLLESIEDDNTINK